MTDNVLSRGSYFYRLKLVTRRACVSLWRTPEYGNTRLINHITVGLITGLAYLNIGNSRADLQYRVFVIFQLTVLPSMILSQIQPRFELARTIFNREKSSAMYESVVFLFSVTIAELPYVLVCSVVVSKLYLEKRRSADLLIVYSSSSPYTSPRVLAAFPTRLPSNS